MTERFNQTLSQRLAKIMDVDQSNWDEKIYTILMGYRSSRQSYTKQSPYYMLYQQQMRLPIGAELITPDENAGDEEVEVDLGVIISNLLQSR